MLLFLKQVSSEGRHSMRITGLSTIDFRAGFSRKPTLDLKKTSSRPVQGKWALQTKAICSSMKAKYNLRFPWFPGIPTYILLNTTGLSPPARADRLELLSLTGEALKTLPIRYYPERQPYGLWNITEFIPPKEAFFLRVTGYDQHGFPFQRVSSVSFSSVVPGKHWSLCPKCSCQCEHLIYLYIIFLPDAPKVLMPAITNGYYLQNGAVKCQIESLIPFTLRFSSDGRRLGVDQFFRWEIPYFIYLFFIQCC